MRGYLALQCEQRHTKLLNGRDREESDRPEERVRPFLQVARAAAGPAGGAVLVAAVGRRAVGQGAGPLARRLELRVAAGDLLRRPAARRADHDDLRLRPAEGDRAAAPELRG